MQIYTGLVDTKIMGINVSAEMTFREYMDVAPSIIKNNDLQRTPVRSEGKPYELLRKDLISGCVIPPIILAITTDSDDQLNDIVKSALKNDSAEEYIERIKERVQVALSDKKILILDGLQRTLTIISVLADLATPEDAQRRERFLDRKLRFEIYLGLSKQGILYRMLTLNAGQTPMSFRHQLEILYHGYLSGTDLPPGIEVFKEVDERRARGLSKYKFSDVIELFYAFSTGSPLPYDKQALVGNLREMSFLENYEYNPDGDSMRELLSCYDQFVRRLIELTQDWNFSLDRLPDVARPFGNSIPSIFSKTQPMAAFGAEGKSLIEKGVYKDISQIKETILDLRFSGDPTESIDQLITILTHIGSKAKKIGDAQRYYFQLAFRELLLPQASNFRDLSAAWVGAQEKYEMLYT